MIEKRGNNQKNMLIINTIKVSIFLSLLLQIFSHRGALLPVNVQLIWLDIILWKQIAYFKMLDNCQAFHDFVGHSMVISVLKSFS